jgi:hypothetical protein
MKILRLPFLAAIPRGTVITVSRLERHDPAIGAAYPAAEVLLRAEGTATTWCPPSVAPHVDPRDGTLGDAQGLRVRGPVERFLVLGCVVGAAGGESEGDVVTRLAVEPADEGSRSPR